MLTYLLFEVYSANDERAGRMTGRIEINCSAAKGHVILKPLAGIMHKFSATVSQSSALTALCFLALLGVLHEYACGALAPLRYENLCIMRASNMGRKFHEN